MDQEHELDFEHRLTETEQRSKSNMKRLDKLEKETEAINRLATSMEVMVTKQDAMNDNMTKLSNDVETLKSEPGKRWKFVVEKALYFIIAAVVGFFLAKAGLQ